MGRIIGYTRRADPCHACCVDKDNAIVKRVEAVTVADVAVGVRVDALVHYLR